jgi:hypothetical protein
LPPTTPLFRTTRSFPGSTGPVSADTINTFLDIYEQGTGQTLTDENRPAWSMH